ncbi:MAG: L-threonine 3-dehydrogenase [Actinobacteria bacterium]|jgi:threonine 3-dehydrogenase|nr:L-threonine 3-dehydrogenase [Actinomycetota bacterium]
MKALYKSSRAPGLELIDVPEPVTGDHDVKIKVLKTGICGTDLHIESWDPWADTNLHPPFIPGHEFVGRVSEIGADVTSIKVGDLVSGEGHIVCGLCRNCRAGRRHLCMNTIGVGVNRDGAFAEYVSIPESNVWLHPHDIDLELAAIFDPLGNAVHTALSFPVVGEDVLITGAGPIGLMSAAIARFVGARFIVMTDVNEYRLNLARSMGVDAAINISTDDVSTTMKKLGMKEGFDVAFEMSGHKSAMPMILANVGHGARIAALGLPSEAISFDWAKVVTHMITIKGIYGREMYETWYSMNSMVHKGLDVSTVITHGFAAEEWEAAFALARSGNCGKIILDWS